MMIVPALLGVCIGLSATQPSAARTGCSSDGRCFDVTAPNDRRGDAEPLWQRADAADTAEVVPSAPMALAHGTLGEPLSALADDD